MSLDQQIEESDEKILERVNELSKSVVVEIYRPLFDKVKTIALFHMNQNGVNELYLNDRMHFRKDGNFYGHNPFGCQYKIVQLEDLPDYHEKTEVKPGFTEYQTRMNNSLDSFREAVKKSLAELV